MVPAIVRFRSAYLLFGTSLVLAILCPSVGHAQVARIEVHPLSSMTLTDQEFLSGRKEGKPAIVAGELRIPRLGTDRLPAVVLMHPSGGVSGLVDEWSQFLNQMGVATFILDSFAGRGIVSTVNDQSQLGQLTVIVDAYRALELLAKHPRVDQGRIAVMGFSRGGTAALYSSLTRFQRMHGPATGVEFAAYIVFHASCGTTFHNDDDVAARPIRLFHGSADDYVPVAPCRSYVEKLRKKGKDVQLTEYPDAHHLFSARALKTPLKLAQAQTTRRCQLEEASGGQIINAKTGQPFSYGDPCVERGATIAHHPQADVEAHKAVGEFVTSTLRPK